MLTSRLDDIFHVTYGNKFDLNKMTPLSRSEGGINFVSRSSENQGVSATVKATDVAPYPAGLITVALGGTKLLSSFVQERPFYTAQNVAVLRPKMPLSFAQKMFVCLAIKHNRFRYSAFGREANRTIKKLEIPALREFPNWLDDATVAAEQPLLAQLLPLKSQPKKNAAKNQLKNIGPETAVVSDLFDVVYGSNLELNALVQDQNGVNFVSRTAKNNGVSAKVKLIPGLSPIEGPVLSVAGGGSVLETFLQSEPFYSGRDLYVLRPKAPMTNDELLFYCCCMRANMFRYSYGRQANRTLRQLALPALSAIPSWAYGGFDRVVGEVHEVVGQAAAA